jgi:CheY-like chemotaxis protein
MKVLLVENERDLREILAEWLDLYGYEVVQVNSGEEGLEQLNKVFFHYLISDIGLDGINGDEMIRQMRPINPNIKIIIMSGDPRDQSIAKDLAKELLIPYLEKPFLFSDLIKFFKS